MSMPRSNVRALSNVNVRAGADLAARRDTGFTQHLRTRDAIEAVFPMIWNNNGIDWPAARGVLTQFQLDLIANHFPCQCERWDRWPIRTDAGWALAAVQCRCMR